MAKKSVEAVLKMPVLPSEIKINTPGNWCWARLIQLFNFIDYRGKTPTKIATGVPFITAKNIRMGYLDYTVADFISREEYEQRQTRGVSRRGDILFTTEAPMGNVAIADLDEYSAGQRVITFQKRSHTEWINNKFYFYYMLSCYFQDELQHNKTGNTVEGIKAEKLMRFPVPVPPYAEQQRIVDRIEYLLAKLDEVKGKAQSVLDSFETRKAAILHKAFTGELTAKWRVENGIKQDSRITTNVGDIVKLLSGQDFKPEAYNSNGNGIPYITGASNFDNDHVIINRWTPEPTVIAQRADVLLVCKGSGFGKVIIADFESAHIARQIMALRVKAGTDTRFIYYFLQSEYEYLRSNGQGLIPGISRSVVINLPIMLPAFSEQQEIVRILDSLFAKDQQAKEAADAVLEKIDLLKKSILARAFRGELGTNDPNEESALKLLIKNL